MDTFFIRLQYLSITLHLLSNKIWERWIEILFIPPFILITHIYSSMIYWLIVREKERTRLSVPLIHIICLLDSVFVWFFCLIGLSVPSSVPHTDSLPQALPRAFTSGWRGWWRWGGGGGEMRGDDEGREEEGMRGGDEKMWESIYRESITEWYMIWFKKK